MISKHNTKNIGTVATLDSNESTDAPLFVHESVGRGDLAVCFGSVHSGQFHLIRHGSFLALRMEQPSPVQRRQWRRRKSVLHLQQFLVHNRHLLTTRIRTQSQGSTNDNPNTNQSPILCVRTPSSPPPSSLPHLNGSYDIKSFSFAEGKTFKLPPRRPPYCY